MRPVVKNRKKFVPDETYWIGTHLHELRMKAKMTQKALAAKAGISVKTLYHVENAGPGSNITLGTLKLLATAVGSTPLELMTPGKYYVEV